MSQYFDIMWQPNFWYPGRFGHSVRKVARHVGKFQESKLLSSHSFMIAENQI